MKLTHVEEQQAVAEWYKQEICRLLMWSEEEYTTFQHQQGLAYLHWYCNCLEDYKRALEGNKMFWAWWRNCWLGRDMAFCDEDTETISITARRKLGSNPGLCVWSLHVLPVSVWVFSGFSGFPHH